jgi:hypothetical protein
VECEEEEQEAPVAGATLNQKKNVQLQAGASARKRGRERGSERERESAREERCLLKCERGSAPFRSLALANEEKANEEPTLKTE